MTHVPSSQLPPAAKHATSHGPASAPNMGGVASPSVEGAPASDGTEASLVVLGARPPSASTAGSVASSSPTSPPPASLAWLTSSSATSSPTGVVGSGVGSTAGASPMAGAPAPPAGE